MEIGSEMADIEKKHVSDELTNALIPLCKKNTAPCLLKTVPKNFFLTSLIIEYTF